MLASDDGQVSSTAPPATQQIDPSVCQGEPNQEQALKKPFKGKVKYVDEEGIGNLTRSYNREREEAEKEETRRKGRPACRANYGYGMADPDGPISSRQQSSDGSDSEHNEGDETQLLLSRDRGDFEVSGHHLAAASRTTSSIQTLIHLIKGNLGTGILAMPDALRHSGLLVGCAVLPFLAVVCVHCMHLLVWTCTALKERTGQPNLDYALVGEAAFAGGPPRIRFMATYARTAINTFLTITQLGFCCIYIVFMSANIKQIIDVVRPGSSWDLHAYMIIIIIPVFMISMIKTLRSLYYPSLLSNVLILVGLVLLMTYLLQDLPNAYNRPLYKPISEFPLFLSTSIYAFEGIGVVLPLQRSMSKPDELGGYNGVLNTAMTFVTCLYIGMGFYGYLKYGDLVEGSITLNLPRTEPLAMAVNLIFVVAIFLTYALMLYVPVELIWPHLIERFSEFTRKRFTIYLFRGSLVVVTLTVAAIIPHIGLFISLVGAMASSTLALIFPPILHSLTFYQT